MKHVIAVLAASVSLFSMSEAYATSPTRGDALTVCTGKPGLRYNKTGAEIGVQAKGTVEVTVVETDGSLDNLRKLAAGDCNAAIVQSDSYFAYTNQNPNASLKMEDVGPLFMENIQLVCNRAAKINALSDLKTTPNTTVVIGPPASGSAMTWYALSLQSKDYNKVRTVPLANELGLTRIVNGRDAQCLWVVSGPGSEFMKKADNFGDNLQLVAIDESGFGGFKDQLGHNLYFASSIPADTYRKLTLSIGTVYNSHIDIPSYAVKAEFVVASSWYEKNQAIYGDLAAIILRLGQQNGALAN